MAFVDLRREQRRRRPSPRLRTCCTAAAVGRRSTGGRALLLEAYAELVRMVEHVGLPQVVLSHQCSGNVADSCNEVLLRLDQGSGKGP
ncbi:hypothetical protein ACP70R_003499 [Stipagrostis hirtigluma subsp. patula]